MTRQCTARYSRPLSIVVKDDPGEVRCTFVVDHPASNHSFFALQCEDAVEAERRAKAAAAPADDTPRNVQSFLDAIASGMYDPYLEAILAVGHNRKRALRGVRGFSA